MIEETLLKSNYLGKDGFIWWIGQVAPAAVWRNEKAEVAKDGSWAYRCKVRIIGYHTFDGNILSDEDLPWAHVTVDPAFGSAQGSLGSTHNLTGGETVYGFFLDGDDAQQPVIIGCIYRNDNVRDLITKEAIESENSTQFKPFDANTSKLIQGGTQIKSINDATLTRPSQSSTPVNLQNSTPQKTNNANRPEQEDTGKNKLVRDDVASDIFLKNTQVTITSVNGCENNVIGQITQALQDFIAFVNGIQSYIGGYIDPLLNTFVDITYNIRRFASIISGIIKNIINVMRDTIIKFIGTLFGELIGKIFPIPQQPIAAEATKNILNIIFCLFERLLDFLLDFLLDLLTGLVNNTINAAACAIEEFTASILSDLMEKIEELLGPIMSGLDWLAGGIASISSILSQASNIASQVINFIGCDSLKCKTPSKWSSSFGPSRGSVDSWNKVLNNLNSSTNLGNLAIYGSRSSPSTACVQKSTNPTTQEDLIPVPIGTKFPYCIPPTVIISGSGINAQAYPIVGNDGSILSMQILNSGFGYAQPPTVSIIDNSGYGRGATASAVISGGSVTAIYITNSGSGYCKGNNTTVIPLPTYLVTANKYTIYEGDSVTYTITTTQIANGTRLSYILSGGIISSDIQGGSLTGTVTINNNTATKTIKVLQDSIDESVEEMRFTLYDVNGNAVALAIIVVADNLSPILPVGPTDPIQSPPGTIIPTGIGSAGITTSIPGFGGTGGGFVGFITGIGTAGIITTGFTTGFIGTGGVSIGSTFAIGIGTTTGTGLIGVSTAGISTVGFVTFVTLPGDIPTVTPGISTSIPEIPPTVGVGTDNVGIIEDVVIVTPGYGYTGTDTITIGPCVYTPILAGNGSIIGVNPSTCDAIFRSVPPVVINSNTGAGAGAFPVLRYVPQYTSGTQIVETRAGIVTVVDCV